MKSAFILSYLGCALIASAAAPLSAPSAQQILDRYTEAMGGRAALEKIQSRVLKGRVEVTSLGTGGAFELRSKAPNKQVSTIEFGGIGTLRDGYDGTVGWTAAPLQGVRVKEGDDLARVQRTSVFPRELKLKDIYARLQVKGAGKVNGADTWILEAFPKTGKPDRFYFDQKTGILVREESTVSSVLGEITFQTDFSDYRVVDGVKVPYSLRMPKPAELGFVITIEDVKHNVPMADSEFSKPKE